MRSLVKLSVSLNICVVIALISAAVVGGVRQYKNREHTEEAKAPEHNATNVMVRVLEPVTVDDVVTLTGRIDPWEEVILSAEVSGTVEWQGVEEGQTVEKGQELLKIDTIWYQTANAQAQAQDVLAKQELERVRNLQKRGVSSPQDLDRALTQQKLASADLASTKNQLDKAVLRAPIVGLVDNLETEQGEWASVGNALVHLVQVDRVKALVGIPEQDIVFFKEGDTVHIKLDALPDRDFEGVIHRLATTGDKITRTFEAEIALDNGEGLLRPGMTIRAALLRQRFPNSIAVPIFSILSLENQRFAVIENDGHAHIRPIEVGILQGNTVQVTQGLTAGERLIVVGHRDLRDGDPVTVTDEDVS